VPDVAWRIRAASPQDRDALQALWREIDELHTAIVPSFFGWAEDRSEMALRRALAGTNEMLLVAEDREAIRGLAHVILYDTPEGEGRRQTRRAHLDSLVVQSGYRRRGCGRALMQAAGAWAKQKGASQILLTVWKGNEGAERFYGSLGFVSISQVLGAKL
jgi:ribosomal protein S18 acetylase RimI-like enzyme